MQDKILAADLAKQIANDVQFWVALIGLVGVIAGSLITGLMTYGLHYFQNQEKNLIDQERKKLLREMLDNKGFKDGRSLETLTKVTGAEKEECRRLLIQIGGRGFTLKDGREGWCYKKDRPLNEQ